MTEDRPYEVGYRKPPRHSQFRPDQSGNPTGRPKARRSFKLDIATALDKLCGADSDRTRQEQFAENLVKDALAGDPLAMKIVAPIALSLNGNEGEREGEVTPLQQELIEDFNRRAAVSSDGGGHEP